MPVGCYEQNKIPLQNSYVEAVILITNVMAFGGGALGRQLGLDEVMRVELSW